MSLVKFLKTVQCCSADMSEGEQLALNALALHADYRTGRGARPGTGYLMLAAKKSARGVRYILEQLLAKGLVERTEVGNGRGRASVYRIVIEHPAFEGKNPAAATAVFNTETRQCEDGNPAVDEDKPGSRDPETRQSGLPHILTSILKDHPPSIQGPGLVGRLHKLGQEAGVDLSVPGNAKKALLELAARDGEDKVEAKCRAWLRTASFVGLNQPPVFKFLREYDDIDETATPVRDPLPTMADVERLNRLCEVISQRDHAKAEEKWEKRKAELAEEAARDAELAANGYAGLFGG